MGSVVKIKDGVAIISGLSEVKSGEVIEFHCGLKGLILNLSISEVSAVVFGNERLIKEGIRVKNTGQLMSINISTGIIGRVINVIGEFLDNGFNVVKGKFYNVERKAVGIIARQSVYEPLLTGFKALDALIPIGRGQRELIIGDRQTGKTSIAVDSIINQVNQNYNFDYINKNVYCIYITIGQKKATAARIFEIFKNVVNVGKYHKKVMLDVLKKRKVKVMNVQQINKPVLSDDFAKSLGNFKNMQELEQNVKEGILEEKKIKERQRLRIEILKGIYERSKIELPEDMIEQRLNNMITRFDDELHLKGLELSLYLTHLNKNQDDLKRDWRQEAEKQVAFSIIIKKIARDKNISLSQEELDEEVNQTVQAMILRGEIDQEKVNLEELKEKVAENITNERVMDYLVDTYTK